nr:hypothetical protein [Acidaminococcus intestini]
MPIKIDGGLSAVNRLREEGIVTIGKGPCHDAGYPALEDPDS